MLLLGVMLGGAVRGSTRALQKLTAQPPLQDLHAASQDLEATATGISSCCIAQMSRNLQQEVSLVLLSSKTDCATHRLAGRHADTSVDSLVSAFETAAPGQLAGRPPVQPEPLTTRQSTAKTK